MIACKSLVTYDRFVVDNAEAFLALAWRPDGRVTRRRGRAPQVSARRGRLGIEACGQGNQGQVSHARTMGTVRQEGKCH